jgi:hypothetical protein
MNKKDLHIVFGFTGKSVLSQSQFVNPEHSDILELSDPLSEGPLCDLDDRQSTERRKQWVDNVFGRYESETGLHFVKETQVKLQMLLDSAQNYEAI